MRLFDLIFRGGRTPERERQLLEEKLCLEDLGRRIGARLGQRIRLNKIRKIYYSEDEVIRITSKDRILFHVWKMKEVKKSELKFKDETVTHGKNTYSRKHFEAIAEALDWECEILMFEKGNAPALFRVAKANIWLAPIIRKDEHGKT